MEKINEKKNLKNEREENIDCVEKTDKIFKVDRIDKVDKNTKLLLGGQLIAVLVMLIGVLVTIFIFNQREKSEIARKTEIIRQRANSMQDPIQRNSIEKMKRMVEIARPILGLRFNTVYVRNGVATANAVERTVFIPLIAGDKAEQDEWNTLVEEITKAEVWIDHDLFSYFMEVVNFAKKYPFLENTEKYEPVNNSHWTDDNVKNRWFILNEELKTKIENKENLLE